MTAKETIVAALDQSCGDAVTIRATRSGFSTNDIALAAEDLDAVCHFDHRHKTNRGSVSLYRVSHLGWVVGISGR